MYLDQLDVGLLDATNAEVVATDPWRRDIAGTGSDGVLNGTAVVF